MNLVAKQDDGCTTRIKPARNITKTVILFILFVIFQPLLARSQFTDWVFLIYLENPRYTARFIIKK